MPVETEYVEYKESTTELEDAAITLTAMLNKNGSGKVIFGMKDNGTPVGQDIGKTTLKSISQHIHNFIEPRIIPTIDVTELENGKSIITVKVSGLNRPYAYKNSIYIRSGEENKRVPITELRQMFQSYSDLLKDTVAFRQDLTFSSRPEDSVPKAFMWRMTRDCTTATNLCARTGNSTCRPNSCRTRTKYL